VVRRGYDSTDKTVHEFGYGWTMSSSGNGRVTPTHPIAKGWTPPAARDCIFGQGQATATDLIDHTIAVKLGDSTSYYYPRLVLEECITGGALVRLTFQQLNGGNKLEMAGQDQEYLIQFGGDNDPNNPQ